MGCVGVPFIEPKPGKKTSLGKGLKQFTYVLLEEKANIFYLAFLILYREPNTVSLRFAAHGKDVRRF